MKTSALPTASVKTSHKEEFLNRVIWNVKDKMPISKFKMNSVEHFVGVVVKVMPSRYVKKLETRVASIEKQMKRDRLFCRCGEQRPIHMDSWRAM